MTTIPVRAAPPLGATVNLTKPLPGPSDAAESSLIQPAPLDVVHVHVPVTKTSTSPWPPSAEKDDDSGLSMNVHGEDCLMVTAWPAIVTRPVRAGVEFGATVNCTCPGPAPLGGEAVTHGSPLVAVQGQPAAVATLTGRVPPPGGSSSPCGETSYRQPLD